VNMPRLTYSNVVSTLALFLAVSGAGAYAVGQLAARSVGERQLRPGAVTSDKIRKYAVTTPKLKALAVKKGKLAAEAVDTSKLVGGAVTSAKLGPSAVLTEKLAPDAVTGEKLNEATLGEVPSANFANSAGTAASADPPAFARVEANGSLNVPDSKGIASAKQIEAGVYCVTVAAFTPRGAQVTPRFNGFGTTTAFARIGGSPSCPLPQVEIQTWNGGIKVEAPFYAIFYR
jgi:hypothetical protein